MPLVIAGTKEERGAIIEWLRKICFSAGVDEKTGEVNLSFTGTGHETGCKCLRSLIDPKGRKVTITPLPGPDSIVPGTGTKISGGGGGGALPVGPGGDHKADGSPGTAADGKAGTDVNVYVDISDNGSKGYKDQTGAKVPIWLVLAHELTTGHAYHQSRGTQIPAPVVNGVLRDHARENQAIVSENEHRKAHKMPERPLKG
jgi:hypothetical protein